MMNKILGLLLLVATSAFGQGVPVNCADSSGQHLNYTAAVHKYICGTSLDPSVVTLTGSQVLTNKTLTSPIINGGTFSGTLVNAAQQTQTLTDAAPTTWNVTSGTLASWTMGASRTLSNPTNIVAGGEYILRVIQDGTGGRVITWSSNYKGVNGATQPSQPNPTANAETDYYFFSPDGTNLQLIAPQVPAFGQAYLSKSGANLQLCRKDGTFLTINGRVEVIPDTCPTLGVGGLAASTTYYIYAFMSAGVLTLETSATTHATQAGTGVEIKSGDATRTLVGIARTNGSTAWQDDSSYIGVISYFNRRTKTALNRFTTGRTTTSTSYVELNTEIRTFFITWSDEAPFVAVSGTSTSSAVNAGCSTGIGIDGTSVSGGFESANVTTAATAGNPIGISGFINSVAEGSHYATLLAMVSSFTGTWNGSTSSSNATANVYLLISVRG